MSLNDPNRDSSDGDLVDATPTVPLDVAWGEWCDRLKALGQNICVGDAIDDRTRAEGFRSIARQLVYALPMEMEASSLLHPEFVRYQDPWTQWGGPNPDNVYLRATIDPDATYRVWGNVGGSRNMIFSLHEGDMHLDNFGVFSECTLDSFDINDGLLKLTISPDREHGNWLPSHPRAHLLMVRIYQEEWENDPVPTLHIERVGTEGVPPAPPTPESVAAALDRSATWLERSARFWPGYMNTMMEKLTPNALSPARRGRGGAQQLMYGSGTWDLGTEGALLITTEVPEADYWSWSIHTSPWFESGDYANRQTSLSGRTLHVDSDGLVRIVLSQRDPGAPNWIDTEGRSKGLLVFRLVGAQSGIEPRCEVVPVSEVQSLLPADHPWVSPPERREHLRRRRASVARRLR